MKLITIGILASFLGLMPIDPNVAPPPFATCKCSATVNVNNMVHHFLCPPGSPSAGMPGVSITFKNPKITDGECSAPPICSAASNCKLEWPDKVTVHFLNCYANTQMWLKVSGYNQETRFPSTDANVFELGIEDCTCRDSSSSMAHEECEKTIRIYTADNESSLIFEWKTTLTCAKCAEVAGG